MNTNRSILLFILIFTIVSTILGMIHISIQAKGKISKTGNVNVFKTSLESAILLKVEGEIHSGKSTYQSTGADTVLAKLREIEDNNEIKGVLIEINSPGGTVGASQEIFEQLMYLREKKNKKVISNNELAIEGKFLFTIGTLEPRKNISTVIEAYLDLKKEKPDFDYNLSQFRHLHY